MAKQFFSFEVEGLNQVLKGLDKLEDNIISEVEGELESSAATIVRNAKSAAPIDESALRQSIGQSKDGILSYLVVAQIGYAAYREFGSGQHVSVPSGLSEYAAQFKGQKEGTWKEFEEAMRGWCSRHGIPEEAVYPIMAKIYREGSEATPFLFPAYNEEAKKLIERLKKNLGTKSARNITVLLPGKNNITSVTTI